jgi:ABC-type sugar transport system permease subunit
MKKPRGFTMRQKEGLTGFLFISPWLIGFVFFFLLSMITAVTYSFNRFIFLEDGGYILEYIGLRNYENALFENVTFNRELVNSLGHMLYGVPMIIFFSLFMALLLNRKFKLRGITRAVFFLPVIMATPAIMGALEQILFMMMGGMDLTSPEMERATTDFNPMAIAFMLLDFGMPIPVINYVIDAISQLYETIRASGVQILIFLAALQAIPGSLYEVAQIEGATAYESFWKITFPMVSPLILTNVVYTIVDTYQRSDIAQFVYDTAFVNINFGLSSAMSVVSSIVVCLVLLGAGFGISKYVFYQT